LPTSCSESQHDAGRDPQTPTGTITFRFRYRGIEAFRGEFTDAALMRD
jgi:hypothetical protein